MATDWYIDDGWHFFEDPYKTIPRGFNTPLLGGKILGFCAPAGKKIKNLMVVVERANSYTTMKYTAALREYFKYLEGQLEQ